MNESIPSGNPIRGKSRLCLNGLKSTTISATTDTVFYLDNEVFPYPPFKNYDIGDADGKWQFENYSLNTVPETVETVIVWITRNELEGGSSKYRAEFRYKKAGTYQITVKRNYDRNTPDVWLLTLKVS